MRDHPNVLLCTVDSLRKDRVAKSTMPYLRELAGDGIEFTNLYSTAPATAASFVGLIASRYYSDIDGIGLPDEQFTTLFEALPDDYTTLGYSTNQFTSRYYNYDRGVDRFTGPSEGIKFEIRKRLAEDGRLFQGLEKAYQLFLEATSTLGGTSVSYYSEPARTVNTRMRAWIDSASAPWFAWLHHMDPHHPYAPPETWLPDGVDSRGDAQSLTRDVPGDVTGHSESEISTTRQLYDAECGYWDDRFWRMHAKMDDPLTIIVGDHGELLGEHDRVGHPHEMWRRLTNVPCVIHHSDLPSATVDSLQTTLSLAPTILDLLGADVPADMRGRSWDLPDPTPRDSVYGTIETPDNVGMVRTPEWSWLRHESRRSTQESHGELLLPADNPEHVDAGTIAWNVNRPTARELRRQYEAELAGGETASGRTEDDEQVRKHLADLGYLDQQ